MHRLLTCGLSLFVSVLLYILAAPAFADTNMCLTFISDPFGNPQVTCSQGGTCTGTDFCQVVRQVVTNVTPWTWNGTNWVSGPVVVAELCTECVCFKVQGGVWTLINPLCCHVAMSSNNGLVTRGSCDGGPTFSCPTIGSCHPSWYEDPDEGGGEVVGECAP